MLVLVVLVLGLFLLLVDLRIALQPIEVGIQRNKYGEGTKTEELEILTEGRERIPLEVEVSEQMYEGEELDDFFEECLIQVQKEMLGENESPDHVTKNLNLMTNLSGVPVEIEWKLNRLDVINIYGEIQEEKLVEEGVVVELEAILTYTEDQEKQVLFECAVVIYPEEMSENEKVTKMITDEIKEEDAKSRTKEILKLPKTIAETSVQYFRKMDTRGIVLLVMAILMGILFYAQEMENKGKEKKLEKEQMLLDYPEIINKLTLFIGAGMTMKRAFRKIVKDYEAGKNIWGTRFAYEEMKVACREMESGITEAESYERFGKRCNLQEYVRLGALLSQNMRKGTKGITHVLRLEAIQAFENRKAAVKKTGEEAGTKLLVPMFIMLTEVLVMVIVPAFLTMQT